MVCKGHTGSRLQPAACHDCKVSGDPECCRGFGLRVCLGWSRQKQPALTPPPLPHLPVSACACIPRPLPLLTLTLDSSTCRSVEHPTNSSSSSSSSSFLSSSRPSSRRTLAELASRVSAPRAYDGIFYTGITQLDLGRHDGSRTCGAVRTGMSPCSAT